MTREQATEAAVRYVQEADFITNFARNKLGDAFLAGTDWQHAQDQARIADLERERDAWRDAVQEITALECDSEKYPNCRICRSIDVLAHRNLGKPLIEYLSKLSHLESRLKRAEEALEEMALPPYEGSNPYSLLEWVSARASAALKAIREGRCSK